MRTSSPLLAAALVLTSALALTGCKRISEKVEEKAIQNQTGGQVDLQNGSLTIKSDAGTVVVGTSSKLPDDFPKAVPVYPGAKVEMAAKSSQNGKTVWSLTLETGDAHDKVAAFYKSGMSAFKETSSMKMGDSDMNVWQSAQYDVTLMVATGSDQKTTLSMTVASK